MLALQMSSDVCQHVIFDSCQSTKKMARQKCYNLIGHNAKSPADSQSLIRNDTKVVEK